MDLHALGAPLGVWREGICSRPSIPPKVSDYHTGGVTPLSLPLHDTYLKVVGSNPMTGKNFSGTKFNCSCEGMKPMLKLTFISHFLPIQLPCCYLDPSFLLFLPSMESLCKSFVVPRNVTYRLSYLSVLSHTHKPCLGNF